MTVINIIFKTFKYVIVDVNLDSEVFKSIKTNISNTEMHLDEYYNIGKARINNKVVVHS